jgi:hypothetical protein
MLLMMTTDPTTLRKQATPIAKALNAITASTGRPFTMRTEEGRFRIQKAVYLLKRLRYPPAGRFDYNLYLMGPYSPGLTACYYQLEDEGMSRAGKAADLPDATLRILAEALAKPNEFLEGLTTLLDVQLETGHLPAALAHAKAIKAHIALDTWKEVRAFLASHPALTAAT